MPGKIFQDEKKVKPAKPAIAGFIPNVYNYNFLANKEYLKQQFKKARKKVPPFFLRKFNDLKDTTKVKTVYKLVNLYLKKKLSVEEIKKEENKTKPPKKSRPQSRLPTARIVKKR